MLPQAWGSRLVGCLLMRNAVNRDSLRRRLTLKHSRVKGRKTVTASLEAYEREGGSVCVCQQAKFMEERHDQRIWPDFDGVSGPGPCHHIAPSLPPHLQRPAAPSLRSPPLCFCLVGFHQQGLRATWENNTLLYLRVEWDLLKYSTTEWSRSGGGERDFIGASWEMKASRLETARDSTTDSLLIG